MNLLVIGSGGREHAISKKLKNSPLVEKVFCAPGNVGMEIDGIVCIDINENNIEELIKFSKSNNIEFVFVGPEIPLLNGIVNEFEKADIKIFGPTKEAAIIEGSKEFAKKLLYKYNIPTAKYKKFSDNILANEYISSNSLPIVIKADGLAAGKGVVIAETIEDANYAIDEMLVNNKFGNAGSTIIIEDFLDGEEFSLMVFVNHDKFYPMVIAQDHKRAYDQDKGPNTGGMGAYAPVKHIEKNVVDTAIKTIIKPTVDAMIKENVPFKGILYAGLINTIEGPKVIEFNARFGDPETQVILERLESDLADAINKILENKEPELVWNEEGVSLGVVVASKGYPEAYEKSKKLIGIDKLSKDINVFYAGVKKENDDLVTAGGRVLLVSISEDNMLNAQSKLYEELKKVDTTDVFYRNDIGYRDL